ncbi:hypothetical protein M0R19_04960 [Candidatus Pacearchaeota archaeon]|jgi:hypothetical protein|nr:hypothetical protein [Candidatus Pacearchaeota archaeon]
MEKEIHIFMVELTKEEIQKLEQEAIKYGSEADYVMNLIRKGLYKKVTHCPVCGFEVLKIRRKRFCTNPECKWSID